MYEIYQPNGINFMALSIILFSLAIFTVLSLVVNFIKEIQNDVLCRELHGNFLCRLMHFENGYLIIRYKLRELRIPHDKVIIIENIERNK